MKRQLKWYCKECDKSGLVAYDNEISLSKNVYAVDADHKETSPACPVEWIGYIRITRSTKG